MNPEEPRKPHPPEWLPTWEIIAVGVGDTIMLIIFAAVGRATHSVESSAGPVIGTINTAFPFIVAWLALGGILGAFSGKALYPIPRVIWRTLRVSVIAAVLGVLLRVALLAAPRQFYSFRWDQIQPSFMLVAAGVTSLLLLIWRIGWSRFRRLWWPELP
jgi:hypothetical protein